jgi:hypothetical protein
LIAILKFYRRAQCLGVIGDDQKIEWSAQLYPLTGCRDDLLAARKLVGLTKP